MDEATEKSIQIIEQAVADVCIPCESECRVSGRIPDCWGQYGNPCSKFLDREQELSMQKGDESQ